MRRHARSTSESPILLPLCEIGIAPTVEVHSIIADP